MGLFSRKSKAKQPKDAEPTQPRVLSKSVPGSRSNSMHRSQRPDIISHPAYAQDSIVPTNKEAFLPVPEVPVEIQKRRRGWTSSHAKSPAREQKAASKSAPASPRLGPVRASRYDEPPRISTLAETNIRPGMSFADEIALDPVFQEGEVRGRRMSDMPQSRAPERPVQRQSLNPKRTISYHASPARPVEPIKSPVQQPQRAKSQHYSVPSYSRPISSHRPGPESERQRHSEMLHSAPMPAASQPARPKTFAPEQFRQQEFVPSPALRPTPFDDAASLRSLTTPAHPPSHVPTAPLAVLEGLKVNKRGKILDEEGDAIGELVEGDIMDCVRQKVNAVGEVLDEYGRVVGRVRTILRNVGMSTPALNTSSPAVLDRRGDYFNLQLPSNSPMVTPAADPYDMQRHFQDELKTKYRLTMDQPPMPVIPTNYQKPQSPVFTHTRYNSDVRPETVVRVELDASEPIAPIESIPAFDLSEPFLPTPRASPVDEPVDKLIEKETREMVEAVPETAVEAEPVEEVPQPATVGEPEMAIEPVILSQAEVAKLKDEEIQIVHVTPQPSPISRPMQARYDSAVALNALEGIAKTVEEVETPLSPLQSNTPTELVPSTSVQAIEPSPAITIAVQAPSPQSIQQDHASPPTSGYNSSEELSEAESVEIVVPIKKGVRISNLPPTTIPIRPINRTMSDGSILRINAMPSVPESEPLPETPSKQSYLSPTDGVTSRPLPIRAKSARTAPPLPAFPRQSFSGLPPSPFAAAVAANNNGAGLQKRNTMPTRPGVPPVTIRAGANRNRYTMNVPLVSSPLSGHRKTLSTITASTISSMSSTTTPSDGDSDKAKSDAVSIISSTGGKPRTYFTHQGRVTIEAGDLPPSMQKKDEVEVTEVPVAADTKKKEKRKSRFSILGKKSQAVAAH